MAASEKITTKNKKVRFSNTPHESSGYFLRELKNEGLSVKEIEEILKLRADAASGNWNSWSVPPNPLVNGAQGTFRFSNTLPSQIAQKKVISIPYPKTSSKKVVESQISSIVSSLITLIQTQFTFSDIKQKIGILLKKKRAINTLRVLYGIDLTIPEIREMCGIDEVDIENIDIELKEAKQVIQSLNDYYHEYSLKKYVEPLNNTQVGGHLHIKSKYKSKKRTNKRVTKRTRKSNNRK